MCIISAASFGVEAQNIESQNKPGLSRAFKKYDLTAVRITPSPDSGIAHKKLKLRAAGRDLELEVEQHDLRSYRYRTEDIGPSGIGEASTAEINTYKGKVAGEPNSEVRLTIDKDQKVTGFFDTAGERLFVEPARKYDDNAPVEGSVVYREADYNMAEAFACGADVASQIKSGEEMVPMSGASMAGVELLRVIELATEADYEYVTRLGSAAQANGEILSILNMVEGTYNAELALSISVVFQHTWSQPDPFGGASTSDLLTAFQNHWNSNFPTSSVPRDAAHLFTGKSYALSAGIAFVSAICRTPMYAYGVSGYVSWAPGKYMIPAHEIGHNLGANHVDATQSCASTIMNASLSPSTAMTFCSFSRTEVMTYVTASGSCLATIGTPTPTPTPTMTPTPVPTPTATPTPVPTPTPTPPPTGNRTRFDFDGDGRADIGVFRQGDGTWYLSLTSGGFFARNFGQAGDKSVSADYDGDGRTDPAVFRNGVWYRSMSTLGYSVTNFGQFGDIPAPADFDGDGLVDIAVFRPTENNWYILATTRGYTVSRFGIVGDVPMPADYDGDGVADVAVFRPSNGTWYRVGSSTGYAATAFGVLGDKAVSGDFDGDRKADLAVWRPSTGMWYIQGTSGGFWTVHWGVATDIPVAADYNGDGRTDFAVYRPSTGQWYRIDSGTNVVSVQTFGINTDDPVESFYVQ
jgi:hypothetical protein